MNYVRQLFKRLTYQVLIDWTGIEKTRTKCEDVLASNFYECVFLCSSTRLEVMKVESRSRWGWTGLLEGASEGNM